MRQKGIESRINDLNDTQFVPPGYGIDLAGLTIERSGDCYSDRFIICEDVTVGVIIGDHSFYQSFTTVYSMDIQVGCQNNSSK